MNRPETASNSTSPFRGEQASGRLPHLVRWLDVKQWAARCHRVTGGDRRLLPPPPRRFFARVRWSLDEVGQLLLRRLVLGPLVHFSGRVWALPLLFRTQADCQQ